MTHYEAWNPYTGGGSLLLAALLFIITGVLIFLAIRLHNPIEVKRPGKFVSVTIVMVWLLSVIMFLLAEIDYVMTLYQQIGRFTGPENPITPITETSGIVTFFLIVCLAARRGFWVAVGSAIVGTIAAPMIFEFPFDLIVMGRTYPPTPHLLFMLLFFLPLFIVEITSFAMLAFSPLMRLSRYSLLFLAGMFLIFAIWALFGFGYPEAPLPIAMNVTSKILAFATAISLFFPQKQDRKLDSPKLDSPKE